MTGLGEHTLRSRNTTRPPGRTMRSLMTRQATSSATGGATRLGSKKRGCASASGAAALITAATTAPVRTCFIAFARVGPVGTIGLPRIPTLTDINCAADHKPEWSRVSGSMGIYRSFAVPSPSPLRMEESITP
jgi:hypothetical protein